MILIVTHRDDFTVDFVVKELNRRGIQYYRLNCEDILQKSNISISLGSRVQTSVDGIDEFESVWFRRTKYPDLSGLDPEIRKFAYSEIDFFLSNLWLTVKTNRWLSQPDKVYLAENKLLQLQQAARLGLQIPNTLVTGDSQAIKKFYSEVDGEMIVKPLFQNRVVKDGKEKLIFTNRVSQADLEQIERRLPLPSIYQRNIDKKEEYRITVVNNQAFCASVDSQADAETMIDWRRKKLKFNASIVPNELTASCINLVRSLGLSFGAIDLVKDKNDDFFFLEINPNGQWAWIEMDTGLMISDCIIKFLTNGK
jgi:hypothetical protein